MRGARGHLAHDAAESNPQRDQEGQGDKNKASQVCQQTLRGLFQPDRKVFVRDSEA